MGKAIVKNSDRLKTPSLIRYAKLWIVSREQINNK